jgi:pyruvate formate lyase activating enzyme
VAVTVEGPLLVARVPVIPRGTDSEANLRAIGGLLAALGIRELHLMPFHQLGKDKYGRLGKRYALVDLPALRGAEGDGDMGSAGRDARGAFGLNVHIGG